MSLVGAALESLVGAALESSATVGGSLTSADVVEKEGAPVDGSSVGETLTPSVGTGDEVGSMLVSCSSSASVGLGEDEGKAPPVTSVGLELGELEADESSPSGPVGDMLGEADGSSESVVGSAEPTLGAADDSSLGFELDAGAELGENDAEGSGEEDGIDEGSSVGSPSIRRTT